jgi:asparagine synthase (glutamine-hydrolysing)
MSDASQRYWIVFNGEIYNYKELRTELLHSGARFRTIGDTEVLLAAYIKWGQDCLSRLNGMFSFLIWDSVDHVLFGARDRFGEKPLFYAKTKEGIAFASEIKGISPLLSAGLEPNFQILGDYLIHGKMDFSNDSFFQGISSIGPGYQFVVRNGLMTQKEYWNLSSAMNTRQMSKEDAVEGVKALFLDSVRLRMRSDVPIGTCLSGGVDSSAIVCVLSEILRTESDGNATRKTFTAHYSEFDESQQIDDVVQSSRSESYRVSPEPVGLESLADLLWWQDEPFQSFSVYASREVMRLAKENQIKVLMNGQGADEVFAGYSKYFRSYVRDLIRLGELRVLYESLAHSKEFTGRSAQGTVYVAMKEGFKNIAKVPIRGVLNYLDLKRSSSNANNLPITPEYAKQIRPIVFREYGHPTPNAGCLKTQLMRSMMVDHMPLYLRTEDRNSMSLSLESRLPFLDHRLVEYAMSLPVQWFMSEGRNKWYLRSALSGIVPSSVLERRTKFGFPTPDLAWQVGKLKGEFRDLFNSESYKSRGLFSSPGANYLLDSLPSNVSGDPDAYRSKIRQVFRLASAELWLRGISRYTTDTGSMDPSPIEVVNPQSAS